MLKKLYYFHLVQNIDEKDLQDFTEIFNEIDTNHDG